MDENKFNWLNYLQKLFNAPWIPADSPMFLYSIPSLKYEMPLALLTIAQNTIQNLNPTWNSSFDNLLSVNNDVKQAWDNLKLLTQPTNTNKILAKGVTTLTDTATSNLINSVSKNLFDNTEWGRGLGSIFSAGTSTAANTMTNNVVKGIALTEGLGQDVGASVAGTSAGLAGQYIGKGIASLGDNSMLSKGIGQGIATGIGQFGGQVLGNIIKGKLTLEGFKTGKDTLDAINRLRSAGKLKEAAELSKAASFANNANLIGLGASIVGTGLGAAFGPSKEYGGKYGNITQTADTIYDTIQTAAGFFGPVGALVSGGMALNKGLSNIFGSTSGMTKTDAILGSAFMGAPVKWLNMADANTTGTFNNLSWLNMEKANSFMGNAFGNLGDKFDQARNEAGKTYGTFSKGAYRDAQRNIDFANYAWDRILDMADLNELQNIRSLYMSSINNLRYAQEIGGVWQPVYRGKQGMKIFNNLINHNIGMRLLSGAALIDNKQMILSAGNGIKIPKLLTAWQPIEKSDNTRVVSSYVTQPFTEEQWKLELLRRNLEQARRRQAVVSSDNRSTYERQEGQKKSRIVLLLEQETKNLESAMKAILGLSTMVLPSYWAQQATGEDLGTAGSLAVDLASPFVLGKGILLLGKTGQGINKLARLGVSPYTRKWTQFGNREFRLRPGYLGMNGTPIESRGILQDFLDKEALNAFIKGEKPMYLTGQASYESVDKLLPNAKKLIIDGKHYYINENQLKSTINKYKSLYESRLGIKGTTDDIYNYLVNNPEKLNPSFDSTEGLHDIIGISLGYEPENAILFSLERNGGISLENLNSLGLLKSSPEIYDKLKAAIINNNITRGTSFVNGRHVGYSIGQPGYPYYYDPVTKLWNFSSASSDVKLGINSLEEWMNNLVYRKAAEANKIEAESMGLSYIPYYERPEYIRAINSPNIKFKNLNSSVGGESNLSGEITINTGTTQNPVLVVRHEMGHVSGLGKISESAATNPDNTQLLKELKYLRHKSNQVFKEGSEYAGLVDLNRNAFEGIQNARDFGEELGIKIGQEYPGYEKALEIVNSYPDSGFKAGLKRMFRLDKEHMPYVWKALAGTLFTLAATLYNQTK